MPHIAYDVDPVENSRAEYKNPARAAAISSDPPEFGALYDLIRMEIEQVKSELARTKRKLRRAYSEAANERQILRRSLIAEATSQPVYEKRGETALAEVVLAAQLKSKSKSPPGSLLRKLRNRSKARYAQAIPARRSTFYVISGNRRIAS